MRYAILTICHQWRRYLAGIFAVAFSTVLIGLQFGIVLGLISLVSSPVDMSRAQIWIASKNTKSCDLGMPIPRAYMDRVERLTDVQSTDECIQSFAFWKNPAEGNSLVVVIGCNLKERTLGPGARLSPQQRCLLSERGAVILDRRDGKRLGIDRLGQTGEVFGRRMRVVGWMTGMGSVAGPFVLCSLDTARAILLPRGLGPERTTYLLATCRDPDRVPHVVQEMNRFPELTAYVASDFSNRSRWYWLVTTKSGIAVGFVAALGLVVGSLITSQSLYSATVVSLKQLALLRALGAPRLRLRVFVLQQSLLVGFIGIIVGIPTVIGLQVLARALGTQAVLPPWLLVSACLITVYMALIAGLFALRSLKHTEPALLLR